MSVSAVFMKNRVAGILPALVDQAAIAVALILDKTVAIHVAV
jgi:hypothetical protein